jgi:hypothetical protein
MLKDDKQTETISVRLNKKLLDKFRTFAKEDNVSLNSFISQWLTHVVEWDIVAAKAGWVPFPKRNLMAILNELDEEKIIQVATNVGKTIPREVLLTMRGRYGLEEWLSVLKYRAKAAGFSFNQIQYDNTFQVVVKHDMGEKWSLWFKTFYGTVFTDLGHNVEFDITENTTSYKITEK